MNALVRPGLKPGGDICQGREKNRQVALVLSNKLMTIAISEHRLYTYNYSTVKYCTVLGCHTFNMSSSGHSREMAYTESPLAVYHTLSFVVSF